MSVQSSNLKPVLQVAAVKINDNPDLTASCAREISQLKSSTSVQVYTREFKKLAVHLNWNEATLKHCYYEGLQDQIKDTLIFFDSPKTLEELITLSEKICTRQLIRQQERYSSRKSKGDVIRDGLPNNSAPFQKGNLSSSTISVQKTTINRDVSTIGLKKMQQTRSANFDPSQRPILRATIPEDDPDLDEHLTTPVTLSFDNTTISTHAMGDHGSQANIIDYTYALAFGIPMIEREVPIGIQGFDGQLATRPLKYYTHVIELQVGEHRELIEFNVGDITIQPVLLGIPWIRTHDVIASLRSNTLAFPSKYCATHCLPAKAKADVVC